MRIRPHKSSEREREVNLCLNGSFKTIPPATTLANKSFRARGLKLKKMPPSNYFLGTTVFMQMTLGQKQKKMSQRKMFLFFWEQLFLRMQNDFTPETKAQYLPKRSISVSRTQFSFIQHMYRLTGTAEEPLQQTLRDPQYNPIRPKTNDRAGPINQTPNLLQLQCGGDKILRLSQGGNPLCVASLGFSERMTTKCCVISRISLCTY